MNVDDGLSDLMQGWQSHTLAGSSAIGGKEEGIRHHSTCSAPSLRFFGLSSRLAGKSPQEAFCNDNYN